MLYSIKFTDNSEINIVGNTSFNRFDTVGYTNSLLAYCNGPNVFGYMFTNDKYDLDGNRWHMQTTGNRGLFIYYAGGGSSYAAIDTNTQYNGLFMSTDGTTVRITSITVQTYQPVWGFIDGYTSGAQQFAPLIAQNPNQRMINFLTSNYSTALYTGNSDLPLSFGGTGLDLTKFSQSFTETPETTDPYSPGGTSGTGGGHGTFSGTSDNIDFPSLPTLSAVDAGFITLFNPSISELNALASYMWTNPLFDITNWKKIFADPMDAILGLSIVPVNVPSGGSHTVTVGNISTGVSMTIASSQYVAVDCGTLNVQEYWGAYLDYSPFTKAEIYLPYCGTHPLATDDIMGKSVHVRYHIDILSGACCAYVKCGNSVLYTFVGQCSSSIPITGNDWTNVVNGALSIATSIGSMVATGGAAAPLALPAMANTAANVIKPEVEKSGSMGGTGGMLGIQTPYLILTRPNQAIPKYKNKYTGYPSYITHKLSSLSGFTIVDSIHLTNIPATDDELKEIDAILKRGVIL